MAPSPSDAPKGYTPYAERKSARSGVVFCGQLTSVIDTVDTFFHLERVTQ